MAKAAKVVQLMANGPTINPVTALNLAKVKRSAEELASKTGEHRNVLKHAEAKGIDLAAAKEALSIVKSGKTEEYIAKTGRVVEYLHIFGQSIEEAQMNFDFLINGAMPGDEKARMLGRAAGLRGDGDGENPYGVGSSQYNQWLVGLNDGRRERSVAEAQDEATVDELLNGGDDDDESAIDDDEDDE